MSRRKDGHRISISLLLPFMDAVQAHGSCDRLSLLASHCFDTIYRVRRAPPAVVGTWQGRPKLNSQAPLSNSA